MYSGPFVSFLEIKANEVVVLTKSFLNFSLYVGFKGTVETVLLNTKLIIRFDKQKTLDSQKKVKLQRFRSLLVKKKILYKKKGILLKKKVFC